MSYSKIVKSTGSHANPRMRQITVAFTNDQTGEAIEETTFGDNLTPASVARWAANIVASLEARDISAAALDALVSKPLPDPPPDDLADFTAKVQRLARLKAYAAQGLIDPQAPELVQAQTDAAAALKPEFL